MRLLAPIKALIQAVKPLLSRLKPLKPYLRWLILAATLFFIGNALRQHWHEVKVLHVTNWNWLALSLLITLLAHCWTGWVWSWILHELGQPATGRWSMLVYLRTNIAKYLPGNIWHLYGRVVVAKQSGCSIEAATLSVLLEPLLLLAAALILALLNVRQGAPLFWLLVVLAAVHPRILNPLLQLAGQLKGKSQSAPTSITQIHRYPLRPLLGELGFVGLRGLGFVCTLQALQPLTLSQLPTALSGFSIAWVIGLIVPGAPGGLGVFEATALALLIQSFPASLILGSVGLYRIISILAEVMGAGAAYVARPRATPN
jgi:uncharacterized membrane protein YbhN (UPF0104 family)